MKYGVANIGIVPMRREPSHQSEMVSQLLYGETFGVVEKLRTWIRICSFLDNYEGWVDAKQIIGITEKQMKSFSKKAPRFSLEPCRFVKDKSEGTLTMVPKGALVSNALALHQSFRGRRGAFLGHEKIVEVAMSYIDTPYLWGGRTPFGIDCSGLVQMVYRLCGFFLPRDASQQVKYGRTLSFLEECRPGDLAFFDDEEGRIIHVGITLAENKIIHAHGKVRIDFLDHGGIYNLENNQYSHQLRVLKTFR